MHQYHSRGIMSDYKRLFLDGHYIFITCVMFKRNPILITNIEHLRNSFKKTKEKFNFEITGVVVLKDHLHLLIKPENISQYPQIITMIKQSFSQNIDKSHLIKIQKYITPSMKKRNETGVWQRRYYEHTIRDEKDFNNHLDYIHYNSIKHNLVNCVKDWEFSSFHKYVERGNYEKNWGSYDDVKSIIDCDYE